MVLIPKDKGQGVMIAVFVSQEFGFVVDLKVYKQNLGGINEFWKAKNYSDENAAMCVYNSAQKQPLTLDTNPFICELY